MPRLFFVMKKYIIIAVVALFALMALQIYRQDKTIARLETERDRYKTNTEILLSDVQTYRVRDSLSAARVQSLELTMKEFERFRADDAALIKELKAKNRDLSAVNSAQAQTIIELRSVPKDTVILRDSVMVPAVAVHCGDEWYTFDGLLTPENFSGTLTNRDSLLISESVRYKRFLGFLWKTNKVINREINAVNRNPHTKIIGLEYILIKK